MTFLEEIPSPISKVGVKVYRTGQDILPQDNRYVKVYRDGDSYFLAYTFYMTDTKLNLKIQLKDNMPSATVLQYFQNPIMPTSCAIFLDGQPCIIDIDERSIGVEYKLLVKPPVPKIEEIRRAEWIGSVNSPSDLNVGIISTQIGGPCGLAVYADELSEELSKLVSLKVLSIPIWGISARDKAHYERLYREVVDAKLNVVHILQHAGTFHVYSDLSAFVNRLKALGIKVVISATSAYSETVIADASHISKIADLTLLHTQREVDYYKGRMFGRASVVRHGIKLCPDEPKEEARKKNGVTGSPVIATHGMFAPTYKGVADLVSATAILKESYPKVRLLLVCAADRYPIQRVETELQVEYLKLTDNVSFFSKFLSTEEIYSLLHCADVIAFPYVGEFKDISGAFRKGMAARRPVIVSETPFFDPEFKLIKVPQKSPAKLAEAIKDLYENTEKAKEYVESITAQIEELSWRNISKQLTELYLSLWS